MSRKLDDQRYAGIAGEKYQHLKHHVTPEGYRLISLRRARKFARWIGKDADVLELGVGTGWNLVELDCRTRVGYDLVNALPEHVRTRINYARSLSGVLNAYDVVICHHVLEHVDNPRAMIDSARQIMRDDGILIIHVPLETKSRDLWPRVNESDNHLFAWTPRTLSNLLGTAGMEVRHIALRRFGYERFIANFLEKVPVLRVWFRFLLYLALIVRPAFEIECVASKVRGEDKISQ